MIKWLPVLRDAATISLILIAFVLTFYGEWEKATFYMSMACFGVLAGIANNERT